MSRVTVIGTGNIGSTVASIAVKGGADVQLLGRDRDKTAAAAQQAGATAGQVGDAITGDIIVLAVPYRRWPSWPSSTRASSTARSSSTSPTRSTSPPSML